MKKFICISLLFVMLFAVSSFAQEERKITLEEYQILLQQWQDRETAAKASIAIEDSIIADLKNKYKMTDEEIARVQQEIYDMLGVYEADLENYNRELAAVDNQLKTLRNLTPELLYQRQSEIEDANNRLEELKNNPLANIPNYDDKLDNYDNNLATIRARVPEPRVETYVVERGDYLWKISKKPEVYNDPYKWPRIWSANSESISDPNLIYPDQILNIIKDLEKNQHLVVKGEYLSKIASYAENFGDPFAWTKIYEANQKQIEDPNLIYPEQILTVPGK